MDRFRPNIVLDGVEAPFVEDTWSTVRIGNIEFRFAEHCDRCVLTTIDPRTLAQGHEPLRTLARHRKRDGKTYFGVRLVPLTTGPLRVGDPAPYPRRKTAASLTSSRRMRVLGLSGRRLEHAEGPPGPPPTGSSPRKS